MGVVADLVQRLGWPAELVEVETADYVFDFAAYRAYPIGEVMIVAGEAKADARIADRWLSDFLACSLLGRHEIERHTASEARNAHKKFDRLLEARASYLWLVAPGVRRCFRLAYASALITLEDIGTTPPNYDPGTRDRS